MTFQKKFNVPIAFLPCMFTTSCWNCSQDNCEVTVWCSHQRH